MCEIVKDYDQILFINLFYDEEYFVKGKLKKVLQGKDCRVYFVDTVKSINQELHFLEIFSKIFSFEKDDISFLKEKFKIECEYLPVGTSYKYFISNKETSKRDIDVCFVGISTTERLMHLEKIADYCSKTKRNLFIAGHFWHNNHWLNYIIGKIKFAQRHPLLANR